MSKAHFILFDAANTLIHKPALWERMQHAFQIHNIKVDNETLRKHHKIVSEIVLAPDRTSEEFYRRFNSELLYSLGVIPTGELLLDIFRLCTYLPWEPFKDTAAIAELTLKKAILSNFNTSLAGKINDLFPNIFTQVISSEQLQLAKPDVAFYKKAIEVLNVNAEDILFVGDSIKLDMEPALKTGMQAVLIDRDNLFSAYPNRISSLASLPGLIQQL